jgi:hypothetical protein
MADLSNVSGRWAGLAAFSDVPISIVSGHVRLGLVGAVLLVWATPTHASRSWAVGHEIRPGCLKVVAYAASKLLADALAKRLADD